MSLAVIGALLVAAVLVAGAWTVLTRSQKKEQATAEDETARLRAIAPPVGEAWRTLLEAEGLGAHVAALQPLVRPAIRLATTPSEHLQLGQSRIGGQPDLPSDLPWPTHQGVPLGFLAQIDLSALPAAARGPLPPDGHLWFFYVADQSTWGFDPKDAGSARVFYRPAGSAIAPARTPEELPDGGDYPACAVSFEPYGDLPDLPSDQAPALELGEEADERYRAIREYLASGGGQACHKLLGYAQPVQGTMEEECALVTGGLYCGDASGHEDPRAAELRRDAARWRLLLQLDSDDHASMMWGDVGMLYFWVRDDDLAAQRFDRAWMILQCH